MLPELVTPDDTFRTLLRRHRVAAGLGRNELARAAGVDPSYITRLESGERQPPRRAVVLQLGHALRLAPRDLERLLLVAGYAPSWLMVLAGVARVSPRAVAG